MTELGIHLNYPEERLVIRECHGLSGHPIYKTWKRMMTRCYTPGASHFYLYGGRGIRVCEEWHRFVNFYQLMLKSWKPGLSIDRIDPDGNYAQENCRWATRREQSHNRRRNLDVVFHGSKQKLSEVAELHATVGYATVYQRVRAGWDIESALTTPPIKDCTRKPFILRGVEYKTLRGCAKSLGFSPTTVKRFIDAGEGKYL